MYVFSRSTVLADNDGLAWAVGITEHAKRASGLEVELWGQVWSPEFGRVTWTAFAPDLATLAAAGDAMNADATMTAESAKGREFTSGGLDDALYNVVHGAIDPAAPPAEYVTSVGSVCANGKLADGMTTGVELAQHAEKITGMSTMFITAVTGVYGGVSWITGCATAAEMESAQQAMAEDPHWAKQVDKAAAVYSADPSSTVSLIHRRFA
jgi:hypothetical protein